MCTIDSSSCRLKSEPWKGDIIIEIFKEGLKNPGGVTLLLTKAFVFLMHGISYHAGNGHPTS